MNYVEQARKLAAPLLPSSGLPKTPWAGRGKSNWLNEAERRQFQRTPHSLLKETDVTYSFNAEGYRCPEFTAQADFRVISVGCGSTLGYGLPRNTLFHEIVSNEIERKSGRSIVNWNLSLSSASNDYIARLLQLAVPFLQPHLVLVNFTWLPRLDYLCADGTWYQYTGVKPACPIRTIAFEPLHRLASEPDSIRNFLLNYKWIEAVLGSTPWLFSFVHPDAANPVDHYLDKRRFAGCLVENGAARDFARDNEHAGPGHHAVLACRYLELLPEAHATGKGFTVMNAFPFSS